MQQLDRAKTQLRYQTDGIGPAQTGCILRQCCEQIQDLLVGEGIPLLRGRCCLSGFGANVLLEVGRRGPESRHPCTLDAVAQELSQ